MVQYSELSKKLQDLQTDHVRKSQRVNHSLAFVTLDIVHILTSLMSRQAWLGVVFTTLSEFIPTTHTNLYAKNASCVV